MVMRYLGGKVLILWAWVWNVYSMMLRFDKLLIMRQYKFIDFIKLNNKRQKQDLMIKIRSKHNQKPQILKQIIYNHRIEINDQQSQPSFLKLSGRGSLELSHNQCNQLFVDMNNRLQSLQKRSFQNAIQIKSRLSQYQQSKLQNRSMSKHLIEEKRQKIPLTYRKLQNYNNYIQPFEQCNFQMDQDRNYILNLQKYSQHNDINNENSPNLQKIVVSQSLKRSIIQKSKIQKAEYSVSCHKNSNASTPKKQSSKSLRKDFSSKNNHVKTRRTVESGCNQETKRSNSRIYEEILSLYSTARLLAMQKKVL